MWLNVINHPQNLNFYGWYKLSINHQKWSGLLWSALQYLVFVLRMYWPNGPNCKRSRAWLAPKASPQSRCHKGTVMLWLPWCFCKRWMLTSFYWGFLVNTSILPQYRSIPWIVCVCVQTMAKIAAAGSFVGCFVVPRMDQLFVCIELLKNGFGCVSDKVDQCDAVDLSHIFLQSFTPWSGLFEGTSQGQSTI